MRSILSDNCCRKIEKEEDCVYDFKLGCEFEAPDHDDENGTCVATAMDYYLEVRYIL